jgi:hypothetical protein
MDNFTVKGKVEEIHPPERNRPRGSGGGRRTASDSMAEYPVSPLEGYSALSQRKCPRFHLISAFISQARYINIVN